MARSPDYQRDRISLYCADCMDVFPYLEQVDCVITSPPYNLGGEPWPHLGNWKPGDSAGGKSKWKNGSDAANGIDYGLHKDNMSWADYVAWQHSVISCIWDLLPGDGAIFYNHKPRVIGAKLWTPMELIPPRVILRQIIIWARAGGMNFNPTALLPTHEWIMVIARDLFRLKSRAASGAGDVWRMNTERNPHPAPFPLELPAKVLDVLKPTVKTVLDPFMGSGTTGIACIQAGKHFIGIEKDPAFFALSVKRLESALAAERESLFPAASVK